MTAGEDGASSRPAGLDAMEILTALGATFSPDLGAYAAGKIPASQVRCVLCTHAPCRCRYCTVIHVNQYATATARPESETCGMRVDPQTGQCPRGHAPSA